MPTRKGQINVSAKIIADISSGIYRTPANALKELVSNSFDSNARTVIITTGYPDFEVMTCTDNGDGMTAEKFEEVMGRIGGSDKRATQSETLDLKRPLIGKIGIGILAVAQICRKFTVISSTIDAAKRFEATIDLEPFHEQEAYKFRLDDKKVRLGKYDIEDKVEETENTSYTRIILENIDEGFKNRLLDLPIQAIHNFELDETDPKTFAAFVKWMENKKIKDVPEYLKLLWELALITPTTYLKNGPVPNSQTMIDITKSLQKYDFTVIVDGIRLDKPILIPYKSNLTDPYFDYKTYDIKFDDLVNNSRLKFSGYIYHQNEAIYPPELRGIMIRIRNVGINSYDKSFLNFPQSVGPIITGMTGEIYVEEGLESALNIDRNSFRETDPHYLKLQEVIFNKLSQPRELGGILSDARYRSRILQHKKKTDQEEEIYDDLETLIERVFGKVFKVKKVDAPSEKPVKVDKRNAEIVIYTSSPLFPRRIRDKRLYERFIIFYELSTLDSPSKVSADKLFYRFIRKR